MRIQKLSWLAVGVLFFSCGAPDDPLIDESVSPALIGGSLALARAGHSATLLQDGRVLIAGGYTDWMWTGTSQVEIYNPATDTFSPTGSMNFARSQHVAARLADGRVIVAGGGSAQSGEIYDPATGTWTLTAPMAQARALPRGALLSDGRLLVSGSDIIGGSAGTEVYNPATNTWTSTPISRRRTDRSHTVTALSGGTALLTGGYDASGASTTHSECLLGATTWSVTGALSVPRNRHAASALLDGRVVVSGGFNFPTVYSSSAIYNPATGTWSATGSLFGPRERHEQTTLADGSVLVTGGFDQNNSLAVARMERFDPSSGNWSSPGDLAFARYNHSVTVLADGRVLVVGGASRVSSSAVFYASGEIFTFSPICSASLSPGSANHSSGAGSGSFNVAIGPTCSWTVSGAPSWVTVTAPSGGSGMGNGTVSYNVAANTGAVRAATLIVGGRSFAITQAAAGDTTPPTVSITSPAPSAVLSGTAVIQASAADNVGVTRVDFYRGTTLLGSDSTAPYSYSWNTTSVANGAYSLTARAYDAANNSATSAAVNVTVSNAPPPSCSPVALAQNVSTGGSLSSTDCRDGARGANYYVDRYTFTGVAGQQVAISLDGAFDTYVYLRNPGGTVIAQDDDGGPGVNSRIPAVSGVFSLPASGTYTIEATSYGALATGSYTVLWQ